MNAMELPEERFCLEINFNDPRLGLMTLSIDCFDQDELVRAIEAGKKALGLERRIFITCGRHITNITQADIDSGNVIMIKNDLT